LILMYMRFMEATSPWIGRLMDLHHSYYFRPREIRAEDAEHERRHH
jgi:hypothetical protein